ncbi:MAG: molybdenum cofactor guanylyltransferase [Myxococcota bacterium]
MKPTAIILGGGHSHRYGRDKLSARWAGTTHLEHVVRALPTERDEVLLVIRAAQRADFPGVDRVIFDAPNLPEGPLRGITSGLRASNSLWNWVLACDHPRLRTSMLRLLASRAQEDSDAVVFRKDGRAEPLVAMYATRCLDVIEEMQREGSKGVWEALARLRTTWIDEGEWRNLDTEGHTFYNVNTPNGESD